MAAVMKFSVVLFMGLLAVEDCNAQNLFTQGAMLSVTRVLQLGEQRNRFVLQCQARNNGTGFSSVTALRIFRRLPDSYTYDPIVLIRSASSGMQWTEDSVLSRTDVRQAVLGTPRAAFIRYEIPSSRTDCTDASVYRCEIDGTTLRFVAERVVRPSVIRSSIQSLVVSPSNVAGMQQHSNTYLEGTSVFLRCSADTGNPPVLLRWCIRIGNASYTQYNSSDTSSFATPGSRPQTRCELLQTSITSYVGRSSDVGQTVRIGCEKVFPQRDPCTDLNLGRDSVVANITFVALPTNDGVSVQVTRPQPQTEPVTVTQAVVAVQQNAAAASPGVVAGMVFLGIIAVASVVAGSVCLLLARKIRKDVELKLTRETYDSLQTGDTSVLTYEVLNSGSNRISNQHDHQDYSNIPS